MKNTNFLIACALLCSSFVAAQNLPVDNEWKFSTGDNQEWASPKFNDHSWKTISSASPWESQGYEDYDGYAWYRNELTISAQVAAQIKKFGGLMIKYDKVDDCDELYFNGYKIGATGGMPPAFLTAYGTLRKYIVPAKYVLAGKKNLIAVRTYDGGGSGGIISNSITVRPIAITDAAKISYDFPVKEWVFMAGDKQQAKVNIKNTSKSKMTCDLVMKITTDDYRPVDSISVPVTITGGKTLNQNVDFHLPQPGFYRCSFYLEKDGVAGDVEKTNIGYEPEKVVSAPDPKPDFDAFWNQSLAELAKIAPDFQMTLVPEKSQGARNLYHVTMMSLLNVRIEGYYAVPKAAGKHPAIAVYMGYGAEPYYPGSDDNADFCEFVLSVRGQGIMKATNTYGNWDTWGVATKETYYYRAAFMDLIRAIDFLESRPEVDTTKIVAEGGSQGGAFTLAACALDHRIKAAAPSIPFLSDYRDYFKIVSWPRSDFESYLSKHPETSWETLYDVLTYFDIKNFTPKIQCPIFMAAGLQDGVCPNHTNFAGFNNIKSEKKWVIYHNEGHSVPNEWYPLRMEFFKQKLGIQ